MQTFFFIWAVSSLAVITSALIVRGSSDLFRVVMLAMFWPPIAIGLLVSFAVWYARRSFVDEPQPKTAP